MKYLNETKDKPERVRKSLPRFEEERDTWKRLFEYCNEKQADEKERLKQEYKERSERLVISTAMERSIPEGSVPRWLSPMELLTPRELSQTMEVQISDSSDTLADPVVERTMQQLVEVADRLVINRIVQDSGMTGPCGTVGDTRRIELSSKK